MIHLKIFTRNYFITYFPQIDQKLHEGRCYVFTHHRILEYFMAHSRLIINISWTNTIHNGKIILKFQGRRFMRYILLWRSLKAKKLGNISIECNCPIEIWSGYICNFKLATTRHNFRSKETWKIKFNVIIYIKYHISTCNQYINILISYFLFLCMCAKSCNQGSTIDYYISVPQFFGQIYCLIFLGTYSILGFMESLWKINLQIAF